MELCRVFTQISAKCQNECRIRFIKMLLSYVYISSTLLSLTNCFFTFFSLDIELLNYAKRRNTTQF